MSKEKQIEEMAKVICASDILCTTCGESTYTYCADAMAELLYNAGYRKQEWISVDERLPENDTERVLVFVKENDFTRPIGINKIDTDRYVDGKWVRWREYVTHWMPLPEPPKMKGGAE